ncbi:MAG: hypothetical protein C0602_11345 [Denitrovibrio sp.]|nr:MAG: hypothetical protein C0602_11345 [Denitrovibrio sp.]
MISPKTIKGLLVQYILIGMLAIGAVAFISMNVVSTYMKKEISDNGKKLIEMLVSSVNPTLKHPVSDLYTIKQIIEDYEIQADKAHILSNFLANREYFIILQLADFTGHIQHIAPYSEEYMGIDVSRQEYFINAMNTNLPYWSSTHLSSQLDKPFVGLSIKTNSGILTAFLLPETILSDIQQLINISKSYITVADRNSVYTVHPDISKVEQRVNDPSFKNLKDTYNGNILETTEIIDGQEMIVYVDFVQQLGWMVKVHQSLDTALAPVKKIIIYLGILALVVTSLFSLITAKYLFRVDKALENLNHSTVMLSKGNYDVKIDDTDFKDLNSLIYSFNGMASSLSERESQLVTVNKTLQVQIERVTHAEQTFKTLIQSTTGRYGNEFFDNLVKEIAGWFGVETVILSLFDYETGTADAISMYSNGDIVKGYKYPIKDGPCEKVALEGFKYYQSDVAKLFPEDSDLVQSKAEAYLGTPMITAKGDVKGVLCAISTRPMTLPEWGKDLLEIVASKAIVELERMDADFQIRKSLEEKDIMIKEIHHRVKNNMQVIVGLLTLQMDNSSPEVVQQLRESINRIYVMSLLHQKLYQSKDLSKLELSGYIESLVESIISTSNISSEINVKIEVDEIKLTIDQIIPIGLIINELVSNAIKHAFETTSSPELYVKLKESEGNNLLTVKDNGAGFPKGFDYRSSDSLGLALVESLASTMNGSLIVQPDDSGACVKVTLENNEQ